MNILTPARQNGDELLDEGFGSLDDVRHSLHDLHRLNRYLGGFRAITHPLFKYLRQHQGTATILDVGTGNAALINAINQRAEQQNQALFMLGLDLMARHLVIAQEDISNQQNTQLTQANALALPFGDNSIDYIVCSLMLHHLNIKDAVALLREMFRCARHSIILSDLVRGHLPYWSYKLIQPLFNLHPITRQDGEVSIKRGYTKPELEAIAHEAGLEDAIVQRYPIFRMTLVADK